MEDRWAAYGPSDLPPRDAWLVNPFDPKFEKLITPTDDRGLILIDQLIDDVKSTVDPTYTWPGNLEVHHFYFFDSWYPNLRELPAPDNPAIFRNLAIHKGLMPKVFEAWLHAITLPAEVPELEVRRHRVKAWWVAQNLFKSAKETLRWEELVASRRQLIVNQPDILKREFNGSDEIGEAYMQEVMEKNFHRFEAHLKAHEAIPEEFRIIETEEPTKIISSLGRIVSKKSLQLTPVIYQTAA
jgi:hypothetical protein